MYVMLTDTCDDRYVTVFKSKAKLKKCFMDAVRSTVSNINYRESKSWDAEEEAKKCWKNGWFDSYDLSAEACVSITFVETTYDIATVMPRD